MLWGPSVAFSSSVAYTARGLAMLTRAHRTLSAYGSQRVGLLGGSLVMERVTPFVRRESFGLEDAAWLDISMIAPVACCFRVR